MLPASGTAVPFRVGPQVSPTARVDRGDVQRHFLRARWTSARPAFWNERLVPPFTRPVPAPRPRWASTTRFGEMSVIPDERCGGRRSHRATPGGRTRRRAARLHHRLSSRLGRAAPPSTVMAAPTSHLVIGRRPAVPGRSTRPSRRPRGLVMNGPSEPSSSARTCRLRAPFVCPSLHDRGDPSGGAGRCWTDGRTRPHDAITMIGEPLQAACWPQRGPRIPPESIAAVHDVGA